MLKALRALGYALVREGYVDRPLEEDARLVEAVCLEEEDALAGERFRQRVGQVELLGQAQGVLDVRAAPLDLAVQDQEAAELGRDLGRLRALLAGERLQHRLEPGHGLAGPAVDEVHLGEPGRHARRRARLAFRLVSGDGVVVVRPRLDGVPRQPGHLAGPVGERGRRKRRSGQLRRLLEVALRLGRRAERSGPVARPHERLAGLLADLVRVVGVGGDAIGVEEVRGDDLGDLLLAQPLRQEAGRGQVAGLAVAVRERLVGDVPDEVLEEAVLPVLGRARIGLDAQHLLADERREQRLELGLVRPVRATIAAFGNVFPRTAPSWSRLRSSPGRPSSRAAISACSVSGTSSAPISPTGR